MKTLRHTFAGLLVGLLICQSDLFAQDRLPETQALEASGDFASEMVNGIDRFLLRKLDESIARRTAFWHRDFESATAYDESVEPNRQRLATILGVRDARAEQPEFRLQATVMRSALVARGKNFEAFAVSWPAFGDVNGEGLLLIPTGKARPRAHVIAIPDCEQTPEQLAGISPGIAPDSQYARRLAESGCIVLVPLLINRQDQLPQLSHREWLYRSAFELGRGLIGYEVQKVLAAVDAFRADSTEGGKIGVLGWGEGGLIGLYAAALDRRIDVALVSGYFDSRQKLWQEPIDRNVFGLLEQFGDAELASLIAPRRLIIEACRGPEITLPGGRGAPATIATPAIESVRSEFARTQTLTAGLEDSSWVRLVETSGENAAVVGTAVLSDFLGALDPNATLATEESAVEVLRHVDSQERLTRQIHELDRHNQRLLRESPFVRERQITSQLNFDSLAEYEASAAVLRDYFFNEVIGRFDDPLLPPNPQSRRFQQTEKWTGYEVVLDVFPDVFAYGLLLVPNDLQHGERRPVIVCQHGLEGRPQDTIGPQGEGAYSAFSAKLAERGFVVFAPQNPYIFGDRFRSLQRKANPLKKTLFSIITPQHQQIVNWLRSLDFVDGQRIGFYGLSYGGKTAMRVPALVTDYCLSICSADFNEWVDKNASTLNPKTYVNMGEYEIFEFDLGSTFNYAEMAALIAPRPFMVERGHADGVADDWTVAWEYAKVRNLYEHRLKLPDRTRIEWFDGPHKINGVGTFEFLSHHLNWPPADKAK